jgi:signal transduction histidine kinase
MAIAFAAGIGLLFVAAGVVARRRRPQSPAGLLMAAAGVSWTASQALFLSGVDLLFTVAAFLAPLPLAFLAHLALTFPGGRRLSRFERAVVAAPYALSVLAGPFVSAEGEACDGPCPRNLLGVEAEHGTGKVLYDVLLVAVLVLTVCFIAVLVGRWRHGTPAARRVLLPVIPGASVLAAIYGVAIASELGLPTGLGEGWATTALVLLALAPLALLAGLLYRHLGRTAVGQLVVELGEPSPGPGRVRDALARALRDPTVEVAYWLPEREAFVGADGRSLDVPVDDPARAVTFVERDGARVGAIVHDPALRDDPALVEAASAATGLAIENERLDAEVLARLEEVRASRARIVEAGDVARRRIERNLHDGAQQRLVALSMALGMARSKLERDAGAGADVSRLLDQAGHEATLAIRELRELAQGLHPSIVTEMGLRTAVESVAERAPVPVEVSAHLDGRLSGPLETTAYYVVSEALANVAKHAQASTVRVRLDHTPGRLLVEVADDGVGGAGARPGSGLEGLADRVAALGGRLEVVSPPGRGTRLTVELPCE